MFTPNEYGFALFVAILCAICWGSWGNPARASRQRFELFYIDYAFTCMIVSFLYAITLGSWKYQGNYETFTSNFKEASSLNIFIAFVAGTTANIGNMLLVAGIDMIGLAASFPLQGGASLILGTILIYIIDPTGRASLIFTGVAFAFLALISLSFAYYFHSKEAPIEKSQDSSSDKKQIEEENLIEKNENQKKKKMIKGFITCAISALFGTAGGVLLTQSVQSKRGVTPYNGLFIVCIAFFVTTFPVNLILWKFPLSGSSFQWSDYKKHGFMWHILAAIAGIVWTTGTLSAFVSGKTIGYAVSYALGQSAPMVSVVWGILVWKEFRNPSKKVVLLIAMMFILYGSAIMCLAFSK